MSSDRAECPYCGENIKKTATKCPYCHSDTSDWAKRNAKRSGYSTVFIIIIIIIAIVVGGKNNDSDKNEDKDKETTTAIITDQETDNSNYEKDDREISDAIVSDQETDNTNYEKDDREISDAIVSEQETNNSNYEKDGREIPDVKSEFNNLNNDFKNDRQNDYQQSGELFANETEFDNYYTQSKEIYQAEVEKRTILKYLSDNAKFIKTMDFRKETLDAIGESINKPYYSQILDFVIETNKGLNKEWTKNGQYFENKTVFYDAYVSENYKQILKDNKKRTSM